VILFKIPLLQRLGRRLTGRAAAPAA